MPSSLQLNTPKLLLTVASTSTTATSPAFALPVADSYSFCMNITTATAGTMDVVFQTSIDGGTTYVNIPWRFTQAATTTGAFWLNTQASLARGEIANETGLVAATGGTLAKNCAIDQRFMKVTYTIGTGPYAFTLTLFAQPRGTQSGA